MKCLERMELLIVAISIGYLSPSVQAEAEYPLHRGDSPISYDAIEIPGGDFNVTDYQPGNLDEYKFFDNYDYQVDVAIPNNRYVGNVAEALAVGALSDTARIFIPAYDVDANTTPFGDCDWDGVNDTLYPEYNEVYFNGELIGVLDGDNSLWKFNSEFTVPIEKVNFPSHLGDVAVNRVQVAIDVKNKNAVLSSGQVGCRVWATSIDWVGIKFDSADPIYLMTGLGGSPASFENSGYRENLQTELGVYSEIIGYSATTGAMGCGNGELKAVREHAENFIVRVAEEAQLTGSADLHAIGHSMGGLDGRMVLNMLAAEEYLAQVGMMDGEPIRHPVSVRSLLSHGSPHEGTVVADYLGTRGVSEVSADICDFETGTWQIANAFLVTGGVPIATIGADADSNGDQHIDANEATGNQVPPEVQGIDTLEYANDLYQLIYQYDSVAWGTETVEFLGQEIEIPSVIYEPSATPNPNDTMVSIKSATGVPGAVSKTSIVGKNHGTILDGEVQARGLAIGQSVLGWGEK